MKDGISDSFRGLYLHNDRPGRQTSSLAQSTKYERIVKTTDVCNGSSFLNTRLTLEATKHNVRGLQVRRVDCLAMPATLPKPAQMHDAMSFI